MVAVVVVALAVGLSNFGAATAIGVAGVDTRLRLRLAVVFGVFEGAMPLVGLALGRAAAGELGSLAPTVGGVLLMAMGVLAVVLELFGPGRGRMAETPGLGRLVVLGAALSVDNLVIGFALGSSKVNVVVAAVVIALVSVGLSLIGLELGGRLGARLGSRAELVGGVLLVAVGAAVTANVL